QGNDLWTAKPASYPAFAEYSEPPEKSSDLVDTGLTWRALLPFWQPQERTLLRSYEGMAAVLSLRTACVKPSIQAELFTASWTPKLVGNVSCSPPSSMIRDPILPISNLSFNCTIPLPTDYTEPRASNEWSTTICRILPNRTNYINDGAFLLVNTTKALLWG